MADDDPEEDNEDDPKAMAEDNPEGVTGEANLEDNDATTLDHFAAALAYAEEGFHVAAIAAEMAGGLAGRLVDYSSDEFGPHDD
ncbi:unnamed protein product [Linum trigynum]